MSYVCTVPLTLEAWESTDMMVDSLRAALNRWEENGLGALPKSYVPPMNEYDADGAMALPRGIPGLRISAAVMLLGSRVAGAVNLTASPGTPTYIACLALRSDTNSLEWVGCS